MGNWWNYKTEIIPEENKYFVITKPTAYTERSAFANIENTCDGLNITNQKEHHKKKNFQEEYREFLKEYMVDYDERYVWD
jgi:hypothetical protein